MIQLRVSRVRHHVLTAIVFVVSIAAIVAGLSFVKGAHAYSGSGAGTSGNPYRIATCQQVLDIANDRAAYYSVVANIDCTGVDFPGVTGTFTGTLDGQNHTISNLTITGDHRGIFAETSGATIKNLRITSGSITQADHTGSFVGFAYNSTFINLHSAMTITGSDSSSIVGGLVGGSDEGIIIDNSSFTGLLQVSVYSGGLIGMMYADPANLINNSFFDGTITVVSITFPTSSPGYIVGGLAGLVYSAAITNSYSAGTMTFLGDASVMGGLVGITYGGTVSNSFSAMTMSANSGTSTRAGGVFGSIYGNSPYNATAVNIAYDNYRSDWSCGGIVTGTISCTARNVGNATPNYFKNNTTNQPLSTWNFSTVWQTSTGYPTLRSIADFQTRTDIPNNGDANGDGIDDSYQANVLSLTDNKGKWVTVSVPSTGGCTLGDGVALNAADAVSDSRYTALGGLVGFRVYCSTSGATVPVTIIYDQQYNGLTLRYYNQTTQTYSTVSGATFATTTVGGVVKTTVTYTLVDGGALDSDGMANGVIVDPVQISAAGVPNTGVNSLPLSLFIAMSLVGLIGLIVIGRLLALRVSR